MSTFFLQIHRERKQMKKKTNEKVSFSLYRHEFETFWKKTYHTGIIHFFNANQTIFSVY